MQDISAQATWGEDAHALSSPPVVTSSVVENAATPFVVILQERMENESQDVDQPREIKLTATFDKYTVSDHIRAHAYNFSAYHRRLH
jgi:hypothetical protein